VLGVVGSPRSDSTCAALVARVLHEAERRGASTSLLDLRHAPLPFFDPADPAREQSLGAVTAMVVRADVLVLGTPDYHGAPSGVLKNFLDHFWKELGGKLFAITVASNEKGLTVQDHLRTSIRQCYAWALPYGVGAAASAISATGDVIEERIRKRLVMMARDIVVYGSLLRDQRLADLALARDPEVAGFMAKMHLG